MTIGLAVYLNRKKLTFVGAEKLGVLNAIVSAEGQLGKSGGAIGKCDSGDLWLSVGGETRTSKAMKDARLRWVSVLRLRPGDKITVEILGKEKPDKPESSRLAARGDRRDQGARKRARNGAKSPTSQRRKPR